MGGRILGVGLISMSTALVPHFLSASDTLKMGLWSLWQLRLLSQALWPCRSSRELRPEELTFDLGCITQMRAWLSSS